MRIRGEHLKELEPLPIPIIRGDEDTIFLLAGPVDLDKFEEALPPPKVIMVQRKGEDPVPNFEHPAYKKALEAYGEKRIGYMVFKSLDYTEGIEWELFDASDPETYTQWQQELKNFGLSSIEITRVLSTVMEANSLTQEKVEAARKSFLAIRRQEKA